MSTTEQNTSTSDPVTNTTTQETTTSSTMDPFANQRDASNNPFGEQQNLESVAGSNDMAMDNANDPSRRMSKEWDASKVPPSQFQKRKGSVYATPNSRDGHVKGSDRDKAYHDKLKEKGWSILGKGKK